jgi:hypothetical protein
MTLFMPATLLELKALDLPADELAEMGEDGAEIVRMSEPLEIQRQKLLHRVTHQAGERGIHTQNPPVNGNESHAIGSVIEGVLEKRCGRHGGVLNRSVGRA